MHRALLPLLILTSVACRNTKDNGDVDSDFGICEELWYIDYDGDGFGSDAYTILACDRPDGWADNDDDCDDTDPLLLPLTVWYPDADGDGYGDANDPQQSCERPDGYVSQGDDCDDGDFEVNPGAEEICNDGIDNDCDGLQPDACVQVVDSAHAIIAGANDDDNFATGISYAGDVNGDGVDDLWVGASLADTPEDDADAGAVYLIPGPITDGVFDVEELASASIYGEELNRAGTHIVGGHDLDGDGAPDLAVGARRADAHIGNETGAVSLWFGEPRGEVSELDADGFLYGATRWDRFGDVTLVSSDVTGDGAADILVGAPYYDPSDTVRNAGAVYIFPGPFSAETLYADSAPTLVLEGEDSEDLVGRFMQTGDVDGDGVEELFIGAWIHSDSDAQAGSVYMVEGGSSGVMSLADADQELSGLDAGDNLGRSLQSPGDVSGDGYADLFVGAPGSDEAYSNAGAAYLLSGDTLDIEAPIATLLGASNNAGLGSRVAAGGDVDGDGEADYLVAASASGELGEGAVYLYYGPLNGVLSAEEADARFDGEAAQDSLGTTLALIPDIAGAGDGRHDVLLGAVASDRGGGDSGALFFIFDVAE